MEDILAMCDLDLKSVLDQIDDSEFLSNIEKYFKYSIFDKDVLMELFSFTDALRESLTNDSLKSKFVSFFSREIVDQADFTQHVMYNNPLTIPFKEINDIKKDLIENPYEESVGLFKCLNPTCGSMNTVNIKKQTQSADEGMTVFIKCFTCGEIRRL